MATTTSTRGRDPQDPYKYAFGVCMDATRRYGADCLCDATHSLSGENSASHVTVQCKNSKDPTKTIDETVEEGLVVLQVICDQYHHDPSQTLCLEEHFGLANDKNEYKFEGCYVSLDGKDCETCLKIPNGCDNGDTGSTDDAGFELKCGNVVPAASSQETVCFHPSDGLFALEEPPTKNQPINIPTATSSNTSGNNDENGYPIWSYVVAATILALGVGLVAFLLVCSRKRRRAAAFLPPTGTVAESDDNHNQGYFWGDTVYDHQQQQYHDEPNKNNNMDPRPPNQRHNNNYDKGLELARRQQPQDTTRSSKSKSSRSIGSSSSSIASSSTRKTSRSSSTQKSSSGSSSKKKSQRSSKRPAAEAAKEEELSLPQVL